jgi:transposase
LAPLIDATPPARGLRGHPLQHPCVIYADRGYDSERHREHRAEHGSARAKYRWVVERTHAWLHHFPRFRIRFERRADIHEAIPKLGCCLICWHTLRHTDSPYETVSK